MKKIVLISLVIIELFACGTVKKFNEAVIEKKCESALEEIPENQSDFKLVNKAQEVFGTILSYSATGGAYTVQVLWDVAATVGGAVILCSPTIAVSILLRGTVAGKFYCFDGDITKAYAPDFGGNIYRSTRNWRCPEVDGISQSIRKVARCYLDRGDEINRKKALTSLQSVAKSPSFYQCLSKTETEQFAKDLAAAQ